MQKAILTCLMVFVFTSIPSLGLVATVQHLMSEVQREQTIMRACVVEAMTNGSYELEAMGECAHKEKK